MNKRVLLLVTLGIVSVLADPNTKREVFTDNNQPLSPSGGDEAKHDGEKLLNKSDAEQKNEITNTNGQTSEDAANTEGSNMQIYIEEAIDTVADQLPQYQDDLSIVDDGFTLLDREILDRDEVMENSPDEIMQTAAGFVPVPIIRWKHRQRPQRRRFATRRQFKRRPNPYTTWRSFYPYPYSYYSFYRPSSLRYFY